jgi:hypothetical protein
LSANEFTIIDNQSWLLVHVYVMHAWEIIPILFTFQSVVEGGNVDNVIVVITHPFMQQGGLTQKERTKRLICFGVDEASFFQGYCIGMTFQFKEKYVPYTMGQHYITYRTNLVQVLLNLPMVAKVEDLL